MATPKRIGTHSGKFHCDEALACYLLKQLPEFKDATIVRTRNYEVLDTLDIVVDVGGVYDPSRNRFDHHQREFNDAFSGEHATRLSSAGLVYKHFGKRVICEKYPKLKQNAPLLEKIYLKVYKKFVEEVDAVDNGVDRYEGKPAYDANTNLSSRVSWLNPPWNSTGVDPDTQFLKAVALTGEYFDHFVDFYADSWLAAREIVQRAISSRFDIHESGAIIKLEQFCPWKSHLFDIEEENNMKKDILYAVFPDNSGGGWRVQCVSAQLSSFQNRLSLPDLWRGKRDEELSKISGIPGCVFVHASGFIGGNATYEGALTMAIKSVAAK